MKGGEEKGRQWFRVRDFNSVLAYAAALMLTGIPPVVCESVLDEFYSSVRKSIERIKI